MKMNAGIWIGIIGGCLGLAVGIAAVLLTAGETGIYVAGGLILVFGGMIFLFYKLIFQQMINTRRLMKTGVPGTAKIKEVHDTGITINNNPQVKLILSVKNSYGMRYDAVVRTLVSQLNPGIYQPGMTVAVKIDPAKESNVIIDPGSSS